MLKTARILNHLYSGGPAGMGGALALFTALYGAEWSVGTGLGMRPGYTSVLTVTLLAALGTGAVALAKPVRWALIAATLRAGLPRVLRYRPDVFVGIGPGGAIVAGILAKLLVERSGVEPLVYVLDREFKWEEGKLAVSLSTVSTSGTGLNSDVGRVMLVSSEVHTGNTMRRAVEHLEEAKVDYRTFSLITSPVASVKVDTSLIVSDKRGLLPWRDSPERVASRA